jgi:hypothetical protein
MQSRHLLGVTRYVDKGIRILLIMGGVFYGQFRKGCVINLNCCALLLGR